MAEAQRNWSAAENEATVASYLRMLKLELAGESYSKTQENDRLRPSLNGRTKAAVEYKFQNISAVLLENGWIYIDGYKPAVNVQRDLRSELERQPRQDADLDRLMQRYIEVPAVDGATASPGLVETDPPSEVLGTPGWNPRGIKRDYVYRDTMNRQLGLQGELAVVDIERRRLINQERRDLAERVEHVSQTVGDGLGYDVRSFDNDGADRFTEVKTTVYLRETPFFVSRAEVDASAHFGPKFHLYRLFQCGSRSSGWYQLRGPIATPVTLGPRTTWGCRARNRARRPSFFSDRRGGRNTVCMRHVSHHGGMFRIDFLGVGYRVRRAELRSSGSTPSRKPGTSLPPSTS
jgi:hypothetical protein